MGSESVNRWCEIGEWVPNRQNRWCEIGEWVVAATIFLVFFWCCGWVGCGFCCFSGGCGRNNFSGCGFFFNFIRWLLMMMMIGFGFGLIGLADFG